MTAIRIATRRSPLALAQAGHIATAVAQRSGSEVELVHVTSLGDRSEAPLTEFGGVGVFIAAVREAVLAGEADLAVHSLKDLPTAAHPQMHLLAIPTRGKANDVLVSRAGGVKELPPGSQIGTGSPRRRSQLLALRPDLEVVDIRGNVDTRVRKVTDGDFDGVLLAQAGLARLGITEAITEVLSPADMLPAPGQGALAVECSAADSDRFAQLAADLDDPATRAAVTAERAALARLEAGCTAPMGAAAVVKAGQLRLQLGVFSSDGVRTVRTEVSGPPESAVDLGRRAAEEALNLGASVLLGESVP
ncbi:MAG: hydroxymethylbilane synthase [Actinomycetia bacterium]|nr:hydroxymethylbilane synthase [Actinomycetes bacterium]MCH9801502.1 hydroxymethylbilane synthase [Actinomycetes bacterium]